MYRRNQNQDIFECVQLSNWIEECSQTAETGLERQNSLPRTTPRYLAVDGIESTLSVFCNVDRCFRSMHTLTSEHSSR